jgi:predicted CopG family antitoxin
MAVKTITVTEDAYEALKSLKEHDESFSKTILRVARRRSLKEFAGILSKESGERLERAISEARERHRKTRPKRIARIVAALEGNDGRS